MLKPQRQLKVVIKAECLAFKHGDLLSRWWGGSQAGWRQQKRTV